MKNVYWWSVVPSSFVVVAAAVVVSIVVEGTIVSVVDVAVVGESELVDVLLTTFVFCANAADVDGNLAAYKPINTLSIIIILKTQKK